MAARRIPYAAVKLTPAEEQTLAVFSERLDLTFAAERLGIGKKPLAARAQVIREKLGVDTTAEAVRVWGEGREA